ncbi:hypothetical protein ACIPRD_03930 [Streptomyces sp. NPDC090108]|uniref:hypothetical protein n=1 Tax=Streptomyces sp. NPDC090108 TaxID=3365947 RepID=UPI0037F8E64C
MIGAGTGTSTGVSPGTGTGTAEGAAWPPPDVPGAVTITWPPAADGPQAPRAGGLNRRRVAVVATGAAVVGVAVSVALFLTVGHGSPAPHRSPVAGPSGSTHPPSPAPSTSGVPTMSPSPSGSATALPAGFASYDDEEGFRIAAPEGWTRSSVGSSYGIRVVNYRSQDRRERLQIYQVAEQSPDASFELFLDPTTHKPRGFEKLSLRNLDDGDFIGSRLEYLADSISGEPDVGTWRVYDERFVAADGNIYSVTAYAPDSGSHEDELALLTTALGHFCPPATNCDGDALD